MQSLPDFQRLGLLRRDWPCTDLAGIQTNLDEFRCFRLFMKFNIDTLSSKFLASSYQY